METIRRNTLQRYILEEDISSDTKHVRSKLESLRSSVRRTNPNLVKEQDSVFQDTAENLSDVDDGVDDDARSAGTVKPLQFLPTFCNGIDNHQVQLNSYINKLNSKGIYCYNMSSKQFK